MNLIQLCSFCLRFIITFCQHLSWRPKKKKGWQNSTSMAGRWLYPSSWHIFFPKTIRHWPKKNRPLFETNQWMIQKIDFFFVLLASETTRENNIVSSDRAVHPHSIGFFFVIQTTVASQKSLPTEIIKIVWIPKSPSFLFSLTACQDRSMGSHWTCVCLSRDTER